MILIGMLDSPYVRRCAVSLALMDVPFEHRSISVFRNMPEFGKINPVIKAPTFVADDGTVLMDSTLILDYVESTLPAQKRLMPTAIDARLAALRVHGLALAGTDKGVSIIYEMEQRPEDKRHKSWTDRAMNQMHAALGELEKIAAGAKPWMHGDRLTASDVMTACMWRFVNLRECTAASIAKYPALAALSQRAEALPQFAAYPPAEV
ncbi:MAG TPA: glutathione S-transferase family protein [Usitatibacter sp.]|nr:glutathione S-transferase family protein [Usitatibacter sp.]